MNENSNRPTIRILTDSASDFTSTQLSELNIDLVPMSVTCDEASYEDDKALPTSFFWDLMITGKSLKTSQPSPEKFLSHFERAKKSGEILICILVSSQLSGTYQSAMLAKSMVEYNHIHLIDSRNAAFGQQLLVRLACYYRDKGLYSPSRLVQKIKDVRSRIHLFACIDTLEYLVRGGRLSKTAASIGSLLHIKPIITISPKGTVEIVKKISGNKRALKYISQTMDSYAISSKTPLLSLYAFDSSNCLQMLQHIKKDHPEIRLSAPAEIGPTIGSHIGPGGFGIAFLAD